MEAEPPAWEGRLVMPKTTGVVAFRAGMRGFTISTRPACLLARCCSPQSGLSLSRSREGPVRHELSPPNDGPSGGHASADPTDLRRWRDPIDPTAVTQSVVCIPPVNLLGLPAAVVPAGHAAAFLSACS